MYLFLRRVVRRIALGLLFHYCIHLFKFFFFFKECDSLSIYDMILNKHLVILIESLLMKGDISNVDLLFLTVVALFS